MKHIRIALLHAFFASQLWGQDLFWQLPTDLQLPIVAQAYAQYDHPIEFTHLATVAKYWYAIIKTPTFIDKCKERGYWEPVLVFRVLENLGEEQLHNPLKTPLIAEAQLKKLGKIEKETFEFDDVNQKVWFQYRNSEELGVGAGEKGIFVDWGTDFYLALWVNPARTFVYNKLYADSNCLPVKREELHEMFYKSRMVLAHYIAQEKDAQISNVPLKECFDIAEFSPDYYALVLFDSPVLPEKFVTKWPQSLKFQTLTWILF